MDLNPEKTFTSALHLKHWESEAHSLLSTRNLIQFQAYNRRIQNDKNQKICNVKTKIIPFVHIWFVPGSQRQRPVSKRGRQQNIPPCYDIISVQCLQRWGLISWVHKQCWARILTIRYCISGGFPCHNTCLPNPAAFSRSSLTVLFWIMNSQKIQRYLYICTKNLRKKKNLKKIWILI